MDIWLCSSCGFYRKWRLLFLVLFAAAVAAVDERFHCAPGITGSGVTVPSGDIILRQGTPLEILCILSPEVMKQGFNSSQMVFYHETFMVQPQFVNVINESTARLYIESLPVMNEMFYCRLVNGTEETNVCLNSVIIALPPQELELGKDLNCVSENWSNMTCRWKAMNYVKTQYRIGFSLQGRMGARMRYGCPNDTDLKGMNYCFWSLHSEPSYRQPYKYLYILVDISNKFGNISQSIKFNHYANVIPAKPFNLTVLERTYCSVFLYWEMQMPINNFPPGLVHKVEYQGDGENTWHVVDISSMIKDNWVLKLNVTGLELANTFYEFRVLIRSSESIEEDMWSQPANITVRTNATLPGAAPKTDIGSFEVNYVDISTRNVYVYWQRIPESMQNGQNFGYYLSVYEDSTLSSKFNVSNTAYYFSKGLSMNSYRFVIHSVNQEGLSRDSAEVYVPSSNSNINEPQSFTKIAFDERIYELSWKPPYTNDKIDSYTIFWCDNKQDRPYQCQGTLNWTKVPKDVFIKNITVPDDQVYQFAISANTDNKSSGMVWASCTVIHNKTVGKMKTVWINSIGSRYIEVGWKLECSDRIGAVVGFQITYCPTEGLTNVTCKEKPQATTIIGEEWVVKGNVTDLTPYTVYKITVAVVLKNNRVGMASDRLLNTTLESAPDVPPQDVTVSEVTNSSMLVWWKRPPTMNGHLRCYQVYYNSDVVTVEYPANLPAKDPPTVQIKLVNLTSYTNYSVRVSACTVACSLMSSPVQVLTSVGNPGKTDQPVVNYVNTSLIKINWKPPSIMAGPFTAYQVKVVVSVSNMNNTEILNSTDRSLQYVMRECKDSEDATMYTISVRAVNYDNNTAYYGVWSDPGSGKCFNTGMTGMPLWFIWIVAIIIFASLVIAMLCLGKRMWNHIKFMKDVEVKLPPGLGLELENKPDDGIIWDDGWGAQVPESKRPSSLPDEELLLQKKDNIETERGDCSSGCSSGHESVVSSLTGGTRNSSDSGTEADRLNRQMIGSLDNVFLDAGNSLRLRNKPNSSSSDSSNRWDREEPYVMMGSASCLYKSTEPDLSEVEGSYSLLGGVPWRPVPTATGYVSLPPTNHPPFKDPPTKGYIMAGENEPLPPYCRLGQSEYLPGS